MYIKIYKKINGENFGVEIQENKYSLSFKMKGIF